MPSQVPDEQLAQAVLQSAKDGVYPESEEVITADVPATTLPVLLELLDKAREEVKVRKAPEAIVMLLLTRLSKG